MIYGKVIKRHPQTQEDFDDWLSVGTRIIRRKLRHIQPDNGDVVEAIMKVGQSLPEDATDEDFTLRVRYSFIWYYNKLTRTDEGFETRRIFRDIPFISEYMAYYKKDKVDPDELHKFIRSRGYSVSKQAVDAYLTLHSRSALDENSGAALLTDTSEDTTDACFNESQIRDCIQLYMQLYGETPGVLRICKTFYNDVPSDSHERRYALPFVEHLLAFMRHQFGEKLFDTLRQVLLFSNHQPIHSYKEVFHV